MRKINEVSPIADAEEYELPTLDLLLPSDDLNYDAQATEVRRKAKILEKTFADFGFGPLERIVRMISLRASVARH